MQLPTGISLLPFASLAFAACNHGDWGWGGSQKEVHGMITDLCESGHLSGNFPAKFKKEQCNDLKTGSGGKVQLSIEFSGTGTTGSMSVEACKSELGREVDNCFAGGVSRRDNKGKESSDGHWVFTARARKDTC